MNTTDLTPSPDVIAQGAQLVAEALDLADQLYALCARQRMHYDAVRIEIPANLVGRPQEEVHDRWCELTGSQATWEVIHAVQSYCYSVTSSAADRCPPLPSELRRTLGGAS